MMNAARLAVGLQSVGAGELAHQCALEYAQARLQGRGAGDAPAVPLSEHADVRRMLMTQRAWTEGGRLLTIWLSLQLDVRSEEHTSELQSLMRISYAVFCLKKKI